MEICIEWKLFLLLLLFKIYFLILRICIMPRRPWIDDLFLLFIRENKLEQVLVLLNNYATLNCQFLARNLCKLLKRTCTISGELQDLGLFSYSCCDCIPRLDRCNLSHCILRYVWSFSQIWMTYRKSSSWIRVRSTSLRQFCWLSWLVGIVLCTKGMLIVLPTSHQYTICKREC
jgi:hypothetical protein